MLAGQVGPELSGLERLDRDLQNTDLGSQVGLAFVDKRRIDHLMSSEEHTIRASVVILG